MLGAEEIKGAAIDYLKKESLLMASLPWSEGLDALESCYTSSSFDHVDQKAAQTILEAIGTSNDRFMLICVIYNDKSGMFVTPMSELFIDNHTMLSPFSIHSVPSTTNIETVSLSIRGRVDKQADEDIYAFPKMVVIRRNMGNQAGWRPLTIGLIDAKYLAEHHNNVYRWLTRIRHELNGYTFDAPLYPFSAER